MSALAVYEGAPGRESNHSGNFGAESPQDCDPDHRPLRLGTFSSILRAVATHKGVSREAIIADL